jgi:N-dimethylarginine dimethylaminohydrolase
MPPTLSVSANVQSAVQQRAIEMKMAQEKAKEELKQWKELVTLLEQEEDTVQVKLDPKIKQWSEEAVGSVIG